MIKWFKQLDSILRGDATRISSLENARIHIPVAGLTVVIVLLAVTYGLCMGAFAMIRTGGQAYPQLLASAVKMPMLFALTLAVTFPSLYVFNALVGSRLSMVSAGRLLVASLGVMLAVLASLGPIVVFFSVSTTSYPFMVVLNAIAGTVAGVLGMTFLLRTLHRLVAVQEAREWHGRRAAPIDPPSPTNGDGEPADDNAAPGDEAGTPGSDGRIEPLPDGPAGPEPPSGDPSGALDLVGERTSEKAKAVFRIWTIVFALVGAQMSWVLRPFIGNPEQPFTFFRERAGNFFIAVARALGNLLQ